MPMLNSSQIGEVIAMKKMEDNSKGIFVMVISEDGMDLEEVNGRLLKNMIGGKVQKWNIIRENTNNEMTKTTQNRIARSPKEAE